MSPQYILSECFKAKSVKTLIGASEMKTETQLAKDSYYQQFQAAYATKFTIPEYLPDFHKLIIYKRLVWSSSLFLHHWEKNIGTYAAGTLHKYNEIFHCNFINSCCIGKIKTALLAGENPELTISFRKHPRFPAIAVIDFNRSSQS